MLVPIIGILVGLALLTGGADLLVRAASTLARSVGVSPLVVGLTIVAYGTSAPELVVSTAAALRGQGDLALGNVLGSNIFNILVILGLAAVTQPLIVHLQVVRREIPVMIGVSLALLAMLYDGGIGRVDSAILLVGLLVYTWLSVRAERKAAQQEKTPREKTKLTIPSLLGNALLLFVGLALLVLGSRFLVDGSVHVARTLGVSEAVIGLTIVAAGTSLPELATSIVAAVRNQLDIAVGNVVGSNIFNILGIVGFSAALRPMTATGLTSLDLGAMLVAALVALPLAKTGLRFNRLEGGLLLVAYAGYLILRLM